MYIDVLLKYLLIFLVFANLGWIYEVMILNLNSKDTICKSFTDIPVPILSIYGFGGILIYLIYSNFKNLTFVQKVLLTTIIVNIMECVAGQISWRINGYKTWNYEGISKCTLCDGYISLETIIWWTVLVIFVFMFFDWLGI